MTNYVLIGSGTTDENGVAKLDHDANGNPIDHSYIGVGAGEIDVLASLDNPVVEGSIVSVPCNVLDCLYLDTATSDKRTNYTIMRLDVTQSTDKYICTRNADGDCFVDLRLSDISAYKNQTIRFKADIVESDKAVQLRIYEVTPSGTIVKTTGAGASSGTLQTDAVTISNDATNLYFRFMMGNLGTSESCSFRNFRVYID